MRKRFIAATVVATTIALGFSLPTPPAAAQDNPLGLLVSNGMKGSMEALQSQFEKETGLRLAIQFSSTASLKQRIEAGEAFDVTVITVEAIDDLVKKGLLTGGSRVAIGRSELGIGIRAGSSRPDIRTVAAFAQALRSAPSITYPQDGASRGYIEQMFEKLGITADVKPKIILANGSTAATESVAAGKATMVLTLFSEIVPTHGVEILGSFPGAYASDIRFMAATSAKSKQADAAKALIAFLAGSRATEVLKAKGIDRLIAQAPAPLTRPDGLPEWAFNIPDAVQPSAVRPAGVIRVPGSAREYDAAKIAGNANPPDWFPDEHPAAPRSVKGDAGIELACGSCHLMSGQGHPESADLAGMPAEYLIRQMAYYKAGTRKDEARMGPLAKTTSDEDVRQAAEYFAALTPRVFVKVIESATPPKTFIATAGRHRQLHPDGGVEPIGRRILQIPEDAFRTEVRDPHSGFIAYVPPGAIARGEALVKTGGSGKSVACALCHGDTLRGLGEVPRLAGLQPLYIARQLFDFQYGSSAGKAAQLMKRAAAQLSEDDIIAISAYLGSLPPK